ncbi:MAG: hypothetical protein ACTSU7_00350 [Candidatus Heimdallarchaeaceae archaeon]
MKLPTSNKTASYGKRPLIKKGYYPAQLLKVETYNDKDGKIKEGKYGHQLIFSFAIYQGDPDTGKPIKPMFHQPKEDSNEQENVILSKFVYHEYKDKKDETKFQTAITPKSAITRLLKTLGWEFSTDDVDPEDFIGNWVEANVNDYVVTTDDGDVKSSSINDVGPYTGPAVGEIEKTNLPKKEEETSESKDSSKDETALQKLDDLKEQGLLSEEGYKQAVESLKAKETK